MLSRYVILTRVPESVLREHGLQHTMSELRIFMPLALSVPHLEFLHLRLPCFIYPTPWILCLPSALPLKEARCVDSCAEEDKAEDEEDDEDDEVEEEEEDDSEAEALAKEPSRPRLRLR